MKATGTVRGHRLCPCHPGLALGVCLPPPRARLRNPRSPDMPQGGNVVPCGSLGECFCCLHTVIPKLLDPYLELNLLLGQLKKKSLLDRIVRTENIL